MSDIKLLHGDSYELIKDIPDKSVDLVYIDIPYLIGQGGKEEKKSALAKRIKNQVYGELNDIINGIDYTILDQLCRVMKYIYIYIWCSKDQILDITKYFVEQKECRVNYLVWCKTNPTPMTNDVWLPDVEYCLCFKESKAPRYNDGYDLKSKWYLSQKNVADKELFKHPTIKPLELVKRHLLHSTNEGDTVLDCFMGSGTTGVACKELNRNFIGIEIDDEYYNIAKNRINGITANGQLSIFTDTEQLEQGSLFDEV
jgi:DNA modification methylase